MAHTPAGSAGPQQRQAMQDWSDLLLYLRPEDWTLVNAEDKPQRQKLETLIAHFVAMGLRHPSEQTMALIATLVAKEEDRQDESGQRLYQLLLTAKAVMKAKVLRAKTMGTAMPVGYMQTLPHNPTTVPLALLNACFPEGIAPAPPNANAISQIARTVPLRLTNRAVAVPKLPWGQQALQGIQAPFGPHMVPYPMLPPGVALQMVPAQPPDLLQNLRLLPKAKPPPLQRLLDRAEQPQLEAPVPKASAGMLALMDRAQSSAALAGTDSQGSGSLEEVVAAPAAEVALPLPPTDPAASLPLEPPPASVASVPLSEVGVEDNAEAAPRHLAASVQALAKAHYDKDIAEEPAEKAPRKGQKRPESADSSAKKRPAAAKAASAKHPGPPPAPAAKPSTKKPVAKPPSMRRPAAAKAQALPKITKAAALRQRPQGCSRCRQRAGCCPSCWRLRGFELV